MANDSPAVVVHGGAGDLDDADHGAARAGCRAATAVALDVLGRGGSALDAVEAAVRALEDDPTFNAGTGSALNREGAVECDASIMDGDGLRAGAVAALADCDRAIAVARAVLEDGEHALLAADGAWRFARTRGFAPVAAGALVTPRAQRRLAAEVARRDPSGTGGRAFATPGTVGACAIDARGHVAAATSTGGMTYKRPGRIGDSALVGAGTYADDEGGAASATGHGERILRVTLTRVAVDRMRAGASAAAAARAAIGELERRVGGEAGLICVDRAGRLGAALSAATLSWGAGRLVGGAARVAAGVTLEGGDDLGALLGG